MTLPPGVRRGPRLGPAERLRQRRDFDELRRRGRRGGDDVVRIQMGPNGLAWSRFACAIPRRYGNAVARNALRRRYREAFRLEKHALPAGYDLLLSPPRGAALPTLEALRRALLDGAERLARRLARQPAPRQQQPEADA